MVNYFHRYHYALMSKNERLKHLKDQYYFDCRCEACVNNWPLFSDLDTENLEDKVSQERMEKLSEANLEAARSEIKFFEDLAEHFDSHMPNKTLSSIQECIKQCYAILGNKRYLL